MSNLNQNKYIRLSLASAKADQKQLQTTQLLTKNCNEPQADEVRLQEFLEIFQNGLLTPVYQPIIDMSRTGIFGYEALIRGPQGSRFESPLQLFKTATDLNLDKEFEIQCRKLVIRRFAELELDHLLFINISPALLLAKGFQKGKTMEYLQEYAIDPSRIVIEVTEHLKIHEFEVLNNALDYYRNLGFKVALDDLGSGYSSLRLWTEVLPDFIKIDKHFIRNIHSNKIKQSFIRGLLEISTGSNCKIIAEGIETREEFEFLYNAGINYLQGYYFAMPDQLPPAVINPDLLQIHTTRRHNAGFTQDNLQNITKCLAPISATATVREVLDKLQRNPELNLLPVVQEEMAVGLVERFVFLNNLMQSVYGIDLYGKMNIIDYVGTDPVLLDISCTLEEASQSVTSLGTSVQAFIVTQNNRYYGVSTVLDLLHKITEQKICSARHANPLTLLPALSQPTMQLIVCFTLKLLLRFPTLTWIISNLTTTTMVMTLAISLSRSLLKYYELFTARNSPL